MKQKGNKSASMHCSYLLVSFVITTIYDTCVVYLGSSVH